MPSALYLDGDPVQYVDDDTRVSLEFDWETAARYRCAACGADLVETTDGYETDSVDDRCPSYGTDEHRGTADHSDEPQDETSGNADDGPDCGCGPHVPERVPLSWVNSAGISVDEKDDSVTVSVSVGDPRGAFTFTVRRIPDDAEGELAGRLILHVPYPGEPMPHESLTERHPGTYLIG